MAGEFARIKRDVWTDDDFIALSPMAQWLYWVALTNPRIELNGVVEWRYKHLRMMADALTDEVLESAEYELRGKRYLIVDHDSEEALVRSFVRNDGLLKQPNMGTAVHRLYSRIASPRIRGVLVHELVRLRIDQPALASWHPDSKGRLPVLPELLDKPSLDPWSEDFDP